MGSKEQFEEMFQSAVDATSSEQSPNGNAQGSDSTHYSWLSIGFYCFGILYVIQWIYKTISHELDQKKKMEEMQRQQQQMQMQQQNGQNGQAMMNPYAMNGMNGMGYGGYGMNGMQPNYAMNGMGMGMYGQPMMATPNPQQSIAAP